jgi:hypothetical protein
VFVKKDAGWLASSTFDLGAGAPAIVQPLLQSLKRNVGPGKER